MALKFRRGTAAQQSGSLVFGEPYINTDLNTLLIGGNGSQIQLLNISGGISASLIPQTTNGFDLGSATNIWRDLYISTGSIKFVAGTTVVKEITLATFTALESATGSINSLTASIAPRLTNLETTSASVNSSVSNINSFTASNGNTSLNAATASFAPRITNLETTTASLNISVTNINSFTASNGNTSLNAVTASFAPRLTNLETTSASVNGYIADNNSKTGSYARTNASNVFSANQTITGSLFISANLIVQGSSSLNVISQSTLNIGTNLITVNVQNPSVRFGGIAIIDSGSSGASGSLLYDSIQDEFLFVHRGNGTNVTSSVLLMGPETIDNLGNETYLTNNRIVKGTGKEHIVDSQITDDGTTVSIGGALTVTGNITGPIRATNGVVSGSSQIVGSSITTNAITIAGTSTALGGTITAEQIRTAIGTVVTGSAQINAGTTANFGTDVKTILNNNTVVSGSSQITLSSTTGYGTVINQNLLTTSDVRHNSLGIGMAASATAGRIDASGDIIAFSTSDRNFKENITPIPNALEKISKISGNIYDWKSELKEHHGFEGNDVGVIAQEIEEVLPQLVTTRENGYKAVKYDKLVALLIEGIKEQQIQINELKAQIGSK